VGLPVEVVNARTVRELIARLVLSGNVELRHL
jgi:hypothetical protein